MISLKAGDVLMSVFLVLGEFLGDLPERNECCVYNGSSCGDLCSSEENEVNVDEKEVLDDSMEYLGLS